MILTPGFNENDTEYSVLAVPYEKESVQITVTASGENAVLYIDGREAESGEPAEVPLEVGKQVIPIRLEDRAAGTESSASVSIYRKQSAASYKTEAWRDQYHFSPLEGWMNDPNGLIYYNDQWHLFYQYIPLTRAHSDYEKHWGHAVSDDLVHWEELPVALAPDELGSIWSGSTVNDPENKSGLFAGPGENNLLAFFTHMNSSGQVQSVAYSEDGGVTWEKYAGNPILTQEDDPLHDGAFRDPNVFWCEEAGKYLMVVAGGPVRIFSSDNLLDWEFESGYNGNSPFRPEGVGDIYSECPDLFPLAVDGDENNAKWVYTGAGRWYMIGDLKEIDGHWSFIPETGAISMTMAPDSYAGVTFKNADGGRVVMVSWMADWGTIQNAPTDGWSGTYTLCYDLALRTTEDGIRLFQEPVKEYETLRGEPLIDETDIVIEENGGNILNGCRSDQFELVAHLEPEESVAEVGFRMFVGTGQEMVVKYNPQTSVLTMDRSRASAAASEYFGGSSSYTIHKNDDGSVDLRIFVDKGSVEVIPNHGEIYGAMLVFPNYAGIGMEAYSTGGDTAADITIYPLDSIWREDTAEEGEPAELYLSVEDGASVNIGDEFTVYSRVAPETADQAVEWILDDPDQTVAVAAQDDISITLRVEAAGDFSLTAAAKGGSVTKTVSIHTRENPFRTNLTDWKTSGNGTWSLTEGGYQGITGHDGFAVGSETFENGFRLEMDVTVTEGTAFGIVFNAEDNPGSGAYMVNFDFGDDQYGKQFRWTEFPYYGDESNNAVARFEDSYTPEIGKKHHVELTWLEGRLTYVIDGHVIFDGVEDKNAGHVYSGGHVGVMGFNSTVVVNDVYAVPAAGLTGLQVSGAALSPAFDNAQTDYEAFVDCGTETVRVTPEAGSGVEITVSGEAVESGSASGEIALAPGENVITVTAASWNGEKTYTISVYRLPFEDVHQEDWFIDSIHYVYQRGIMIGHNEREFDPNMPMIRADTALVLYRVEGIATGYSSGLFGTADPVTREQAVTMLFRYASRKGYAVDERTSLDRFADAGQVSGFAEETMEWAVARGIISGKYDQTVLDPQGYASRAEYAAMIMRFMESYQ